MRLSITRPESVSWGLKADRLAVAVALVVGLPTALSATFVYQFMFNQLLAALIMMAVLAIARRRPGLALVLFWAGSAVNMMDNPLPLFIQVLAGAWLAYTSSRFGSRVSVIASALSVVVGSFIGAVSLLGDSFRMFVGSAFDQHLMAFMFIAAYLGVPWMIGVRHRARAQLRAQRERAEDAELQRRYALEAQQTAVLEEQRLTRVATAEAASARLARDVHDVVGHSLAVILMQAESAQYLTSTDDLHESMKNIATSARRSLGEIREVLHAARANQPPMQAPSGGLGALLESVAASGVALETTQLGQSRALPPDAETVAYRVLQEMLTNAIKHGEHGSPIAVQFTWADRLTMEVRNLDGGHTISRALHGAGISGMTSRLRAVGGSFELNRHYSDDGEVVTAIAWLPLRAN